MRWGAKGWSRSDSPTLALPAPQHPAVGAAAEGAGPQPVSPEWGELGAERSPEDWGSGRRRRSGAAGPVRAGLLVFEVVEGGSDEFVAAMPVTGSDLGPLVFY